MEVKDQKVCKICGSSNLKVYLHTAKCGQCGVLLTWPYPPDDEEISESGHKRGGVDLSYEDEQIRVMNWHLQSGNRNHNNFTNMIRFALNDSDRNRKLRVLDFGGGGGSIWTSIGVHVSSV
jgi:hypothetical protein